MSGPLKDLYEAYTATNSSSLINSMNRVGSMITPEHGLNSILYNNKAFFKSGFTGKRKKIMIHTLKREKKQR